MNDATPVPTTQRTPVLTAQRKTKRTSIKTKFLLALLVLSLLPLILFMAIARYVMMDLRNEVKKEFLQSAHADIGRLAKSQAAIARAMLGKVEMETQTAAFFAQALLRDPAAFSHTRSYSASDKPEDSAAASKYVLAPDLSADAAQPVLDLTSNMDGLFDLIAKGDPNLEEIYIGTQSGVYRTHPWNNQSLDDLDFKLYPAPEQLSVEDKVPGQLRQAFKRYGVTLSAQAVVKTIVAENQWVISDEESGNVFSLRREKSGLAVYSAYDPRTRPWYRRAIGRVGVAWTKYPNWGGGRDLFSLKENQIGDKVSTGMAQEFAERGIYLIENAPISIGNDGRWSLQDRNGNNYELRETKGKLNVYDVDIVTCSRAVLDREGRLAGVVGLDMSMESLRTKIIHTPDEVAGYSFLLSAQGELVDQERPDMFIPAAGSPIRSNMNAGKIGHDYDAAAATDVFYAPIYSADGKTFWSLGFSMPEAEITRLAEPIRRKMFLMLELVLGIGAAMVILVIGVANRMSDRITGPIESLGAGVMRIGSGDLDYSLDVRTGDEIEDFADAFNKMVGDLKTYIRDLKTTTAEKERFASELRVAHDIQMSFLKKIFPAFPHRSEFSLYATIKTAREVGGDLYDFSLLDDTRLFFYVGDVADKGVPASLIMAITMTLMKRASVQPGITPAGILDQVNKTLAEDNENVMFVTLFAGILDLKTGDLAFSNAGHNPPVILRPDGECSFLKLPDGLVLGAMTDAKYCDDTVRLGPGDMIVTYTDGVTEAMNPKRELYSEARLKETVMRMTGRSVEDTIEAIITSVKNHAAGAPQSDDIAVLAVKRS
jgi:sigma-B regulation protein RsbU (phosphoserine phosphatase)